MSGLPGILGAIAEVTSEAAALKLARELGGTSIKLSDAPDGKLAMIVGPDFAKAIVKAWAAGYTLTIPMANLRGAGARRAQVARMLASGQTISQAALGGDVHERTAKRIKARLRDQGDLPLFQK